jgi:hypothetical protein
MIDVEFRVYRGKKVIYRALFPLHQAPTARRQIEDLQHIAHKQFRVAHPDVGDAEIQEHWAIPGQPD